MPCYTRIRIDVPDDELHKRARRALALPEEGELAASDARRVLTEAGVLKAMDGVRRVRPDAVVRRRGNDLVVTVTA